MKIKKTATTLVAIIVLANTHAAMHYATEKLATLERNVENAKC